MSENIAKPTVPDMTEMIEVEEGMDYDDATLWWTPVKKRTPKYRRRIVPRELFERWQAAAKEYSAAVEAMQRACST